MDFRFLAGRSEGGKEKGKKKCVPFSRSEEVEKGKSAKVEKITKVETRYAN